MAWITMSLWMVLLLATFVDRVTTIGQFNGGSMSFQIIEGATAGQWDQVHLDLITGWRLGQGPCGPGCNKTSISSSTQASRVGVLATDSLYLGNWTAEYKLKPKRGLTHAEAVARSKTQTENLNTFVNGHMNETVIAVNELGRWEQEWMTLIYPIPNDIKYIDITYEGMSWRNLTLQGEQVEWHIQVKIKPDVRSDTNRPNISPQALSKPFYRLRLNHNNTIHLAVTDPDGDYVRCALAQLVEGGILASHPLPNIICTEDCTVIVPAMESYGYSNGSWGAIAITVRDYNTKTTKIGHDTVTPGSFGLSGVSVEFLVEILENFTEPILLDPTPPQNQKFTLYTGSVWAVEICARTVPPILIDDFYATARQREPIHTTQPRSDSRSREGVECTDMTWKPEIKDVGEHIFCVGAVDDRGFGTSDDRCYSVDVKETNFTGSSTTSEYPRFIDFPASTELQCDVKATCEFPLFIETNGPKLSDIKITRSFVDSYHLGTIQEAKDKCLNCYRIDLFFQHDKIGQPDVCLIAKDDVGTNSTETCLQPYILAMDPCASMPCKNGAQCKRSVADASDFVCHCASDHYAGKLCEHETDDCVGDPCIHGVCIDIKGPSFYCNCSVGYKGRRCETEINKCDTDPCNGNGICNAGNCDCYKRYSGAKCMTDLCPGPPATEKDCSTSAPPGCAIDPCLPHGVCSTGGHCTCPIGYNGAPDDTSCMDSGDLSGSSIKFVDPTPADGSIFPAYTYSPYLKVNHILQISAFFTKISSGVDPNITVVSKSDGLTITTGTTSVTMIPGFVNIYTSSLTIQPARTSLGKHHVCFKATDGPHSSERRCIQLIAMTSPLIDRSSQEAKEKDAPHKFEPPTIIGGSRIQCYKDQTCHTLVYTSKVSSCEQVVSLSNGVTVFPTELASGNCRTDVAFKFSFEGTSRICMKAADIGPTGGHPQAQTLCVYVDTIEKSTDPCHPNQCLNKGICLRNESLGFQCMCSAPYSGDTCDNGPCPTTGICSHGYCGRFNETEVCSCTVGYKDTDCSKETGHSIVDPKTDAVQITDAAVPDKIVCVLYKPCTMPFAVSGKSPSGQPPNVVPGYVSPSVTMGNINITDVTGTTGMYTGSVTFTGEKSGSHPICIQTHTDDDVNKDEVCFEVDIRTDTSLVFGDTSKPHFVPPSIPNKSQVKCGVGIPCHLLLVSSPGQGHLGKCTLAKVTQGDVRNIHVFSTCNNCIEDRAENNACDLDVSLTATTEEVGTHTVCVELSLESVKTMGEKRCLDVIVETVADFQKQEKCQTLHCQHGGFCDGHGSQPECHCPLGFSGNECETDETGTTSNTTYMHGVDEIVCSISESCVLPFKVNGPVVETGFVDPGLIVDKPVIIANGTGGEHTGNIHVTPTTPGVHSVCIQAHSSSTSSQVLEEKCIKVTVSDKPSVPVDESRPYYVEPTLPRDSIVSCAPSKACYFVLHTTRTINGTCPEVIENTDVSEGLYLFDPEVADAHCIVTVSYIPPASLPVGNSTRLCFLTFTPGVKGEERCFSALVKATPSASGPCQSKDCKHGGKAVADLDTSTCQCVCSSGFSGTDCSTADAGTSFVPPTNLPSGGSAKPPQFTDTPIPEKIVCHVSSTCTVPLIVTGEPGKTPGVTFGGTDPALIPGVPVVTTTATSGKYQATIPVTTPSTVGEHTVCVQTVDPDTRTNIDELCFKLDIKSGGSTATPDPSLPSIVSSFPANSSLICVAGKSCHLITRVSMGTEYTCPVMVQTTSVPNVVPLNPVPVPGVGGQCDIDTVFTPDPGTAGTSQHICLKPSGGSETTCYDLKIQDQTTLAATNQNPCKTVHCQNGGKCDLNSRTPVTCSCPISFTGSNCETPDTTSGPLPAVTGSPSVVDPGTPNFIASGSIPTSVQCEVNKPCTIPILYSGDKDKPPTTGHVDPGLLPAKTDVYPVTPALPDNTFVSKTTVTPTTVGTHRVCIQTKDSKTNIDEICVNVTVAPDSGTGSTPAPAPGTPQFRGPGVMNNTDIICQSGKTCHIPVITSPGTNGNCNTIVPCSTSPTGVHVMDGLKNTADNTCVMDVTYTPLPSETSADICVTTRPGGEKLVIQAHVQDLTSTATGSCQKLHCENGGVCEATSATGAVCSCTVDFSGTTCHNPSVVPDQLPGGSAVTSSLGTPKFDLGSALPKDIKCVVGQPCTVPLVYEGDPTKPPVLGHVDSGLVPSGTKVIQQTPPLDGGRHLLQTTITPTTPGPHRMCLQTLDATTGSNVDEVCFDVNVAPAGPAAPNPNKPHFDKTSLPDSSSMLCEQGRTCHLAVATTPDSLSKCSPVTECGSGVSGVHIFQTTLQNGVCLTDVTHTGTTTETKDVCLSSGSGGEERHFNLDVKPINGTGPCQITHCKNGGFCDAKSRTSSVCQCPAGSTGADCSTDVTMPDLLPGGNATITLSPNTSRFDSTNAILENIKCHVGSPCVIPVPYIGPNPPTPGHVDPNLDLGQTDIVPGPNPKSSDSHTLQTTVTSTKPGQHKMCFQTLLTTGSNADELCFTIDVAPGAVTPTSVPDPTKPSFAHTELTDGSTVRCQAGSSCNIPLTTSPTTPLNACPQVHECGSRVDGLHVFPTKSGMSKCSTDVVYSPASGETGTKDICISSGPPNGEEKHIKVNVDPITSTGPCQSLQCAHGFCDALPTAKCICKTGYSGSTCATDAVAGPLPGVTGLTTPSPTTPKFDASSALPKDIKCEVGQPCTIPIVYKGDPNKPPVLGHVDSGLETPKTAVIQQTPPLGGDRHLLQTTITPSTAGPHRMCLQTMDAVAGTNADEICFDVTVSGTASIPPDATTPHFSQSSLPDHSELLCQQGQSCHLSVATAPDPTSHKCNPVTKCSSGASGVHIFPPSLQNGVCLTDVTNTVTATGTQSLCLSSGPGGEQRHVDVNVKPITGTGPCQTLHCKNGGFCDSIAASSSVCRCPAGYTGMDCSTPITDPNPIEAKFDGTGAVVDTVKCRVGASCVVSIPFLGSSGTTLNPGHIDSALTLVSTSVVPGLSTDSQLYQSTVTPTSAGTHQICLQTLLSNGSNSDEVCVKVDTTGAPAPTSTPPDLTKPSFSATDLTDGSIVRCPAGTTCHIPVVTEQTNPAHECPHVKECGSRVGGLHVFPTQTKPMTSQCSTDVIFSPASGETGTKDLCILSGPNGEEKHMKVILDNINSSGPCRSLLCVNGYCDGIPTARCLCKIGYSGTRCDKDGGTSATGVDTTGLPTSTPTITDTALPTIVSCYLGEPCNVPLRLTGDKTQTPEVLVLPKDHNLGVGTPNITQSSMGQYNVLVPITTSTAGIHKVCTQTRDPITDTTVDEVCFAVNIKTGPSPSKGDMSKATIGEPSLPSGSTVLCKPNFTCHILTTYTKGTSSTSCPPLEKMPSSTTTGTVKIFSPTDQGDTCTVDTALAFPDSAVGHPQKICLKPSSGNLETCYDVQVPASIQASPCTSLRCQHGGTCISNNTVATCSCTPGFEGDHCDLVTTSTLPTTTPTTTPSTTSSTIAATTLHAVGNTTVSASQSVHATSSASTATSSAHVTPSPASVMRMSTVSQTSTTAQTRATSPTSGNSVSTELSTAAQTTTSNSAASTTLTTSATNTTVSASQSVHATSSAPTVTSSAHVTPSHASVMRISTASQTSTTAQTRATAPTSGNSVSTELSTAAQTPTSNSAASTTLTTSATNTTGTPCVVKTDSAHARKMVEAGKVRCSCDYKGKTVQIIKRKPVATSGQLAKSGGIAAAGVSGAMGLAALGYLLINKLKKKNTEEASDPETRRRPSPKARGRVHPGANRKMV